MPLYALLLLLLPASAAAAAGQDVGKEQVCSGYETFTCSGGSVVAAHNPPGFKDIVRGVRDAHMVKLTARTKISRVFRVGSTEGSPTPPKREFTRTTSSGDRTFSSRDTKSECQEHADCGEDMVCGFYNSTLARECAPCRDDPNGYLTPANITCQEAAEVVGCNASFSRLGAYIPRLRVSEVCPATCKSCGTSIPPIPSGALDSYCDVTGVKSCHEGYPIDGEQCFAPVPMISTTEQWELETHSGECQGYVYGVVTKVGPTGTVSFTDVTEYYKEGSVCSDEGVPLGMCRQKGKYVHPTNSREAATTGLVAAVVTPSPPTPKPPQAPPAVYPPKFGGGVESQPEVPGTHVGTSPTLPSSIKLGSVGVPHEGLAPGMLVRVSRAYTPPVNTLPVRGRPAGFAPPAATEALTVDILNPIQNPAELDQFQEERLDSQGSYYIFLGSGFEPFFDEDLISGAIVVDAMHVEPTPGSMVSPPPRGFAISPATHFANESNYVTGVFFKHLNKVGPAASVRYRGPHQPLYPEAYAAVTVDIRPEGDRPESLNFPAGAWRARQGCYRQSPKSFYCYTANECKLHVPAEKGAGDPPTPLCRDTEVCHERRDSSIGSSFECKGVPYIWATHGHAALGGGLTRIGLGNIGYGQAEVSLTLGKGLKVNVPLTGAHSVHLTSHLGWRVDSYRDTLRAMKGFKKDLENNIVKNIIVDVEAESRGDRYRATHIRFLEKIEHADADVTVGRNICEADDKAYCAVSGECLLPSVSDKVRCPNQECPVGTFRCRGDGICRTPSACGEPVPFVISHRMYDGVHPDMTHMVSEPDFVDPADETSDAVFHYKGVKVLASRSIKVRRAEGSKRSQGLSMDEAVALIQGNMRETPVEIFFALSEVTVPEKPTNHLPGIDSRLNTREGDTAAEVPTFRTESMTIVLPLSRKTDSPGPLLCDEAYITTCLEVLAGYEKEKLCPQLDSGKWLNMGNCGSVDSCPTIVKKVAEICSTPTEEPMGDCKLDQIRSRSVRCDPSGNLWLPLQSDIDEAWCVDPYRGRELVGTRVPLSEGASLTCRVPSTGLNICAALTSTKVTSIALLENTFGGGCLAPELLRSPMPVIRLISVRNLIVTLDRTLSAPQKSELRGVLQTSVASSWVFFLDDPADPPTTHTRFAIGPTAADILSERNKEKTPSPPGNGASPKSGSNSPYVRKEIALETHRLFVQAVRMTNEIEKTTTELLNTQTLQSVFGKVEGTGTLVNLESMLVGVRAMDIIKLRADFGANIGFVEFLGPDATGGAENIVENAVPVVRDQEDVNPTRILRKFNSFWLNTRATGGVSWGIYEPRTDGSCPRPDDAVFDPMRVGFHEMCTTSGRVDVYCRVGDFNAKHRMLNPNHASLTSDDSALPISGWASIKGKMLVIGTDPIVCAEIRGSNVSESASTKLVANFSSHLKESASGIGISGTISISQPAPATDALIRVALDTAKTVRNVTYHISRRQMGDFSAGSCLAGYDRDADIYGDLRRHHPKQSELLPMWRCENVHPSALPFNAGCPEGMLTPFLRDHRTLPAFGTASHPFLDVAYAQNALRPQTKDGTHEIGWAVVILSDGEPIACAPLLTEDEFRASLPKAGVDEEDSNDLVWLIVGCSAALLVVLFVGIACFCGACSGKTASQENGTVEADGILAPKPARKCGYGSDDSIESFELPGLREKLQKLNTARLAGGEKPAAAIAGGASSKPPSSSRAARKRHPLKEFVLDKSDDADAKEEEEAHAAPKPKAGSTPRQHPRSPGATHSARTGDGNSCDGDSAERLSMSTAEPDDLPSDSEDQRIAEMDERELARSPLTDHL